VVRDAGKVGQHHRGDEYDGCNAGDDFDDAVANDACFPPSEGGFACASVPECPPSARAALRSSGRSWLARNTDEIADNRKGLIRLVAEHAVSSVWEDLEP
jgi:hypothetical protein